MAISGYVGKYYVKSEKKSKWFYVITLGKDENGKRIQHKKRGFKSKTEAKNQLMLAQNSLANGAHVYASKVTYGMYLMEWFNNRRSYLGSQTVKVNEQFIKNHIIPSLGKIPLDKLNTLQIKEFVSILQKKELADSTIRRIFNIVNSSLNAAEKEQLIPKNFASLMSDKPKVKKKALQVWDISEVQSFLKTAKDSNTRYYIAFHLALTTGMRQGEILGLRWSDIDFERKIISVNQTLTHDGKELKVGTKTLTSIRSISIDSVTMDELQKHHEFVNEEKLKAGDMYKDNNLVIGTNFGTPCTPRNLTRTWYKLLEISRLRKITFHGLRHTHASLLLKTNTHPKVVSERLGHSKIQTTMDIYSHLFPSLQEDAANQLSELLFHKSK